MDRSKLENTIKENLEKFSIRSYTDISEKEHERLISIESFLLQNQSETEVLIKVLKGKEVTISSIASKKEVGMSRKTIYNNNLILTYIEHRMEEGKDIFNQKRISDLQNQISDLKKQYDKVINQNLDYHLLKLELKQNEKDLTRQIEKNDILDECVIEKDNMIYNLKSILQKKKSNVIDFDKR